MARARKKDEVDKESLRHFLAPKDSISKLAKRFPSLKEAKGVDPFDSRRLEAWASESMLSPQARHTVQFILSLWDMQNKGQTVLFDAMDALHTWDEQHRAAFISWATKPWFP